MLWKWDCGVAVLYNASVTLGKPDFAKLKCARHIQTNAQSSGKGMCLGLVCPHVFLCGLLQKTREANSIPNILGMCLLPNEERETKAEVIRALKEEWRISCINTSQCHLVTLTILNKQLWGKMAFSFHELICLCAVLWASFSASFCWLGCCGLEASSVSRENAFLAKAWCFCWDEEVCVGLPRTQ